MRTLAVAKLLSATFGALLTAPSFAQVPVFETAGPPGATGYGVRVAGVGDMNGDGVADVAVADRTPVVRIHSGADWNVLFVYAPPSNGIIITGLAAIDGDGDGTNELVVAYQTGTVGAGLHIHLIEVATGSALWQYYDFQFIGEPEIRLIPAGDLTGDGIEDLLVGVPDYDIWHPAWWDSGFLIMSGANGGISQVIHNPEGMGEGLALINDVSGDGKPDIAVSSPIEGQGRGMISVYDTDGPLTKMWQVNGPFIGAELGEAMVSIGDVDGDGFTDLAALETGPLAAGQRALRVNVMSSTDGSLMYRRTFPAEGYLGLQNEVELESLGDLNGDGVAEIAMFVPLAANGGAVARILSGADLATLHQWTDPQHTSSILPGAIAGDFNGDGTQDLIIGDPDRGSRGWITILPGESSVGTQSCDAAVANSTGSPASLRVVGSPEATSNDLELLGLQLPSDQWVLPLAAPQTGFVPQVGGGAGTLCLGGSIRRLNNSLNRADGIGSFSAVLDLSTWHGGSSIVAGETWYYQLWYRDPAGGTTSNLSDATGVTFE